MFYIEYTIWGFFIGIPLGIVLGILYNRMMSNIFKKRRERAIKKLKENYDA